jgi:hypothetical protein
MLSHSLEVTRRCTVYTFHLGPLQSPAHFVLGHMDQAGPRNKYGGTVLVSRVPIYSRGVLVVLFLFIFRFSFSRCDS